jgi:hypothetical protein
VRLVNDSTHNNVVDAVPYSRNTHNCADGYCGNDQNIGIEHLKHGADDGINYVLTEHTCKVNVAFFVGIIADVFCGIRERPAKQFFHFVFHSAHPKLF